MRKLHGAFCPSIKPNEDESLVKRVKHNFGSCHCTFVFRFRVRLVISFELVFHQNETLGRTRITDKATLFKKSEIMGDLNSLQTLAR